MNPTKKGIDTMLRESNAIEDVFDSKSMTDAKLAWNFIQKFDHINAMIVKETHKILMKNQGLHFTDIGVWRNVPVTIGGVLKNEPPLVIDEKIKRWCKHVNNIIDAYAVNHDIVNHCHVRFEDIHPFVDGNGRIGRILLNWQLTKMNLPIVTYYSNDKPTYYRLFSSYRAQELIDMLAKIREDGLYTV